MLLAEDVVQGFSGPQVISCLQVEYRPHLNDSPGSRGNGRGIGQRLIKVGSLDQLEAGELFLGFGVGPVREHHPAVLDS